MTLSPRHIVVGPDAKICASGFGFTVTVTSCDTDVHPPAPVTVTRYTPDVVGDIVCPVRPLLHRYESVAEPAAVNVSGSSSQIVIGPAGVIVGVTGFGNAVTETGSDVSRHPFGSIVITRYVPAVNTFSVRVVSRFGSH